MLKDENNIWKNRIMEDLKDLRDFCERFSHGGGYISHSLVSGSLNYIRFRSFLLRIRCTVISR